MDTHHALNHLALTDKQSAEITKAAQETAQRMLSAYTVTCDLCPGNGTRYFMVVACMVNALPENDPWVTGPYLLALPGFQTSYFTSFPGYTDAGYAAEKWTRGNLADGEVIAAFMNEVARFQRG
jgi:hypothetical protein